METDRQGSESGACDGCCSDCSDEGTQSQQPTIFTDTRASLARRDYAKLLASVGGLTAVASLTAPLAGLTRVFEREYTGPVYSDGIYLVDGDGNRIEEKALSEGEKMTVFPEPRPGIEKAPTLLVRHAEDAYSDAVKTEYMVAGYTAYSKVCTHAGCMVSNEEDGTLVCPCHFGKFDPTDGAAVVGGPPSRALPQLPITVSSEGYLIATGDFNGPVGPGGD
ncbi:(2Fe-2S)-binding protein (plasmid) [Haloferax mediterranei ATCC 33500]|uniref:Putative respiratory nitrate reductase subunit Rieske n=2 Tax=Haloferax mediterranei (strain ATCC 33500 / DSM 1411 / JCM 8866 / NBRC 14739 / NCIMB 2177 / R-4) TaxID=523841 RepID=NARB_HALMT|nr:Rieske 2Fe-2S domain-containing protein [Haloferax mediterranei]I3R9N2.1 RecName: Full=Putative respiratory nitrate reductase subunit Rieske [Haloferax mediterranei ATCC 33500]AFK20942.1 putative Rieske iron-sulfur protein [Haloferax mediterranei ATCC 33500]AHZ24189.1 (2Fe-2S)-binding protein [Haloferax mediterranei ATCC 33500]EMA05268.1 putative Rieske iron-sulfur protein [Haloferax mediterranei ATCC 33500]MDX5989929.1 Rieske 2Fe-2S domain-containing protein [Haloferax mediterranei ATCC 33